MLTLYALQTLLPLLCIGWIAMRPPRSLVGFWSQVRNTRMIVPSQSARAWEIPGVRALGSLVLMEATTTCSIVWS